MSGLSESQYTEGRSHLMAIDEALRTQLGAKKTHCEGIMVASTNSFGTPKESLAMDVEAIRNSNRSVFYLFDGEPRPSGMWVEAGVALGLEKPCTFLDSARTRCRPASRRARAQSKSGWWSMRATTRSRPGFNRAPRPGSAEPGGLNVLLL